MNNLDIKKFVNDGLLMNLIIPIDELECQSLERYLSDNVINLRGLPNEYVWVINSPASIEGVTLIAYKFHDSLNESDDELIKLRNQIISSGKNWMLLNGKFSSNKDN